MIVDDEVVIAAQLEESLTAMGHEVVGSATNGAEAVEQALRLRPDMVFMDVVMPGELDGITAAERIKQTLDVPIIFVTAYSDQSLIDRAKDLKPAAGCGPPAARCALGRDPAFEGCSRTSPSRNGRTGGGSSTKPE